MATSPHDRSPTTQQDPWPRRVGIALGAGVTLAVVVAVGLGLRGVAGGLAAAIVLGILTLVTAALALVTIISAVVDERRGQRVPWRRLVVGVVLLVATVPLGAMTLAAIGLSSS